MIAIGMESQEALNYDEAWLYCATLEYDGHRDWRIPTSNEYTSYKLIIPGSWYNAEHLYKLKELNTYYRTVVPVRDYD